MNAVALVAASFPETYVAARNALARCEQIDECQDWACKASAMASYAKQSRDDSLIIMAQRIQARAIRRCGELLKAIPAHPGGVGGGVRGSSRVTDPKLARSAAARAAGLSTSRKDLALRVASIPAQQFEALVEAPRPATVTQLSRIGTYKPGRPKGGALGSLRRKLEKAEAVAQRKSAELQKALAEVQRLRAQIASYMGAA